MGNPSASWPGRPALSVSSGSDEKPLIYGIKGKRDGSRLLLSAFMRTCRHTTQAYVCHTQRDWKKNHKKGWNIKDGRDKWESKTEFGRVLWGTLSWLLTQPGGYRPRRVRGEGWKDRGTHRAGTRWRDSPWSPGEGHRHSLTLTNTSQFQGIKRFGTLKGLTLNSIAMS